MRPCNVFFFFWVQYWRLAEFKIQFTAILNGDIDWVYEGREHFVGFVLGEDEDFGGGDGVKPALYPTPDSREEGGSTDNLW